MGLNSCGAMGSKVLTHNNKKICDQEYCHDAQHLVLLVDLPDYLYQREVVWPATVW